MILSSLPALLVCYQFTKSSVSQTVKSLPNIINKYYASPVNLGLKVLSKNIRPLTFILKGTSFLALSTLADIAAIDYIKTKGRFGLNYLFSSPVLNYRFTITLFANETASVPSLLRCGFLEHCLFPSANWLEREVWDLFGVYFSEHSDLRRILTDYGFSGHPLRKDFPLTGFYELVYNDAEGRLSFEPVELSQELRIFNI